MKKIFAICILQLRISRLCSAIPLYSTYIYVKLKVVESTLSTYNLGDFEQFYDLMWHGSNSLIVYFGIMQSVGKYTQEFSHRV